jgi:hypothetical protein
MKTFLLILVTSLFTLQGVFSITHPVNDDQYCAKLRDGKLVMMHDGIIMTADVTLQNGTQIKMDGSIIKQDGETIVLKDGECVDKNGISGEKKPKKRYRSK